MGRWLDSRIYRVSGRHRLQLFHQQRFLKLGWLYGPTLAVFYVISIRCVDVIYIESGAARKQCE